MASPRSEGLLDGRTALAVAAPALLGLLGAAACLRLIPTYGFSLFLVLPLLVSFLAAYVWSFGRHLPYARACVVASLSVLALCVLIVVFAMDGLACVLMSIPLGMVTAPIGALLGWKLASSVQRSGTLISLFLCAAFPLLVSFERAHTPAPSVRAVTTEVWIDAPIEEVWNTVIAFPEIESEPGGIFRLGIAYPIRARIEGKGEGALRYCTFSTGSFVEPITEWSAPNVLAFDVTENPPPMRETSIYADLDPPHLHGFMVSKRGEFRLSEQDGRVRLEGTTWYRHALAPEFYWGRLSDAIIHRIHRRVLDHIRVYAES